MKSITTKMLSVLILVCLLTSVLVTSAGATTTTSTDYYTFELNEDGESYAISASSSSLTGEVFVPEEYNGLPVTRLSSDAFSYGTRITKVWLPESVVEIEDWAFYGCTALVSIDISPDSTNIVPGAFDCCNNLVNFTINGDTNGHGNDIINADGLNCGEGYFVRDGVLFSNSNYYTTNDLVNKKLNNNRLEKYPSGRTETTYVIPNNTMVILSDAFSSPQYLETIVVPASVQNFYVRSFFNTSIVSFNHPINVIMQHDSYPTDMAYSTFRNLYTGSKIIVKDSVKQAFEDNYSYYVYNMNNNVVLLEAQDTPTTALSLNYKTLSLEFGESGVIEATQTPVTATDTLIFTSSNDSIVSFDEYGCGRIEAKGVGTAVLTVTSGSVSATCTVTVTCEHKTTHMDNISAENCTQNGYTGDVVCDECDTIVTKGSVIPAWGHTFGEWEVIRLADCVISGSKQRTCSTCGYIQKQTIPATGHNYITVPAQPATCTQTGYTSRVYCSYCERESTQATTIPATGHTFGEWVVVHNATCVSTGLRQKTCSSCGYSVSETIRTTAHTPVKDPAVAATCTTAGKTEGSHCSVCNTVIKAQTTVAAKGHTASNWKTNTSNRTRYKECTVCKAVLESQKITIGAPTITSCYNEVNGVQLKWSAVSGAKNYRLYRKLPSQANWTLLTTTSSLAYQDTNVTGNTVYQYVVKAVDANGIESVNSAQRECRFLETPELISRTNAVGGVTIKWNKVAGATSYRIYRRGAGTDYWFYLGSFPATLDTFTDLETANYFPDNASKNAQAKPKSGNYYRYTVRASYDGKDSAGNDYTIYSGFDKGGLYLKYVATPKLTSISNASDGLQIKWNAVAGGGPVEYRVYRRGAGQTYWKYLGTTKNTTWTDSGVKVANGGYYRYTVRAVAGTNGKGWYSAFDTTGLYLMRLANPTLKSATTGNGGITVKWNSIKGSTGYYVYRKTANSGWQRVGTVSGVNNTTFIDKSAVKGTTYTYTVRACYGYTLSSYNSGISCKR